MRTAASTARSTKALAGEVEGVCANKSLNSRTYRITRCVGRMANSLTAGGFRGGFVTTLPTTLELPALDVVDPSDFCRTTLALEELGANFPDPLSRLPFNKELATKATVGLDGAGVEALLAGTDDAIEVADVETADVADSLDVELELAELSADEPLEGTSDDGDGVFFHVDMDLFNGELGASSDLGLLSFRTGAGFALGFIGCWGWTNAFPLSFATCAARPSNHAPTFPHHPTNPSSNADSSPINAAVTPQTFGFSSIRANSRSLSSMRFSA